MITLPARFCIALSLLTISNYTYAEEASNSLWSKAKASINQTWQSQDYELYIPVNTWHNRHYYTKEDINDFNERPWGIGLGKYRYDEDGDWHGIYAMAFLDSQSKIEPIVGVGFQKIWRASENIRLGLGYSVGVTVRDDFDYIPIPFVLPLFSVKYKEIAVQSTYIPGGKGNGNILFTWLRWEL